MRVSECGGRMGAKCREEKCSAAGYAKPPCPLKEWRDGRLCERHSAHGRREARVAGQAAETYAFRMRREDGREMLGCGKTRRGGICKAALPAERMAGWAAMRDTVLRGRHSAHGRREIRRRDRRLKYTRFGCGGRMGVRGKRGAARYGGGTAVEAYAFRDDAGGWARNAVVREKRSFARYGAARETQRTRERRRCGWRG